MNSNLKKMGLNSNLSLTESQELVLNGFKEFIASDLTNTMILKGSAGTGKTTLLKLFSDFLSKIDNPFQVCAPTGRAAQVLRSKGIVVPRTIHSLIYRQDKIEEVESNDDFIFRFHLRDNSDSTNTIYLIDEASMISDNFTEDEILRFGSGCLLKDLLTFISPSKVNNRKMIFFGDNNQLPPVNSSHSPALDKDYLESINEKLNLELNIKEFNLTEVVRQAKDSTIIKNANSIKDNIEQNYYASFRLYYSNNDFKQIKPGEIIKDFTAKYKKDPVSSVIIAYTNAIVRNYNLAIRENLFTLPSILEPGDRVIVVKNNSKYHLLNGEMGIIKKINPAPEKVIVTLRKDPNPQELYFRGITIEFNDINAKSYQIDSLILENVLTSAEPGISRKEQRALIVDFTKRMKDKGVSRHSKEFTELMQTDLYFNCLQVKYGYAVTCYKAQGGEWPYVYFDFRFSSPYSANYFRFCYTAITRAKKVLFAINPPHNGIGSSPEFVEPDIEEIDTEDGLSNIVSSEVVTEKTIASFIENKISSLGIEYELEEKPYRVRIKYPLNNLPCFTDISYKKDFTISYVQSNRIDDGNIIYKTVVAFVGYKLESKKLFTTNNPFFERLQIEINERVSEHSIEIINVDHLSYQERYHFSFNGKSCAINFYYNNKNRITRKLYHHGSKTLANKILEVLNA